MDGEKLLWLGIGIALGWLVIPMILGMFVKKQAG